MTNLMIGLVTGIVLVIITSALWIGLLSSQGSSCDNSSTVAVYNICKRLEACNQFGNNALRSDCRTGVIYDTLSR